jgi:hypothetical protein
MVVRLLLMLGVTLVMLAPQSADQPEALSLLGKLLVAPSMPADTRRKLEAEP